MNNKLSIVLTLLIFMGIGGLSTNLFADNDRSIINDLCIFVSTDKDLYKENEPIIITLNVYNPNDDPVVLEFGQSIYANYLIDDKFDYVANVGVMHLPILTNLTIEPHQEINLILIHQPEYYFLRPGLHEITGILVGYGEDIVNISVLEPLQVDEVISDQKAMVSNYPNPFNPETTIFFTLDERGNVKIDIFNIRGQLVKNLIDTTLPSGEHSLLWDGKDFLGVNVPSGVYFFRFAHQDELIVNKMALMK